jgi:hypothetical protein
MPSALRDRLRSLPLTMLGPLIVAAIIAGYGLKCIALQNGTFIDSDRRGKWGRYGVPIYVKGRPALAVGEGYLCVGLFFLLFPGRRLNEDDTPLVYVIRCICSLASLAFAFWFWHIAHHQIFGS